VTRERVAKRKVKLAIIVLYFKSTLPPKTPSRWLRHRDGCQAAMSQKTIDSARGNLTVEKGLGFEIITNSLGGIVLNELCD